MSQRDHRLIGGVYRTSQVVISGGILTNYTAYNHNTNEIVGLIVLESPSPGDTQTVQQFFQSMEHRRSVKSPQVLQVYDWGIDGNRVYLATDPPRGVTLRYVLDNENIDLRRALDFAQQMTRGLIALKASILPCSRFHVIFGCRFHPIRGNTKRSTRPMRMLQVTVKTQQPVVMLPLRRCRW